MKTLEAFGLGLGSVGLALGLWACTATRNGDGTITIRFAPDMVITTHGLEGTLTRLTDLLDRCITGNFERPCTAQEMKEINKAIRRVLRQKGDILDLPPVGTLPS